MSGSIVIRKSSSIYVIQLEDILYMEKALRKIKIHMCPAQGGQSSCLEFYGRFRDVKPYLDSRFLCCHRGYIINMDRIVWMDRNTIYVETNEEIYMGRETYREAKKIFSGYLLDKSRTKDAMPENRVKNAVKYCEKR